MPLNSEKINYESSIIAFFLPEAISTYLGEIVQKRFAPFYQDGEDTFQLVDPKDYHVTLIFIGDGLDSQSDRISSVRSTINARKIFSGAYYGEIGGAGYFSGGDKNAIYLSVDSPDLAWFRDSLMDAMHENDIYIYQRHGFFPHITIAYSDAIPFLPDFGKTQLYFDTLTLATGENREEFKLGAEKSSDADEIESVVLEKSSGFDEQGNFYVDVIGVPYTGVVDGKADIVGDWFDKSSNVSPIADEIEADFDHGRDNAWLPADLKEKGFGKASIGISRDMGTYEDAESGISGRLYRVIVDRHHKYMSLVKALVDDKILGASMKMSRRVNDPNKKGYIKEATIAKMSLTPTPMNPMAAALYKSLVLEAFSGETEMAKSEDKSKEDEGAAAQTPSGGEKPQNGSESGTEKSLSETIDEIFDEGKGTDGTEKSVRGLLMDVISGLDALNKRVGSIEEAQKSANEKSANVEKMAEDVQKLNEAFPVLAKRVVAAIKGEVIGELEKSADQRDAEAAVRAAKNHAANGKIPAGAPGKN